MTSILDVTVSAFRNYESVHPKDVNLLTCLTSNKYAKKVDLIRSMEDKATRDKWKAQLPAITPSGTFSKRGKDFLIQHSGLIQADIDIHHNEHLKDFFNLKKELAQLPEIAYCGLSVSGRGFWVLVPIAYPDKHEQHFEALRQDFRRLDIEIDATPDVSRLRGYSYDPDAYFNHNAKVYRRYLEPPHTPQICHYPNGDNVEKVEACIQIIEAEQIDITETYQAWFAVGCALANEFGEAGRNYYHRVSQYYPGYEPAATDKQFDSCLGGEGYTIATFFWICKDYGVEFKAVLAA
ncbi:MAG: BT4734/BF3469 family protein [Saprospiraceae bacterium]